VPVSGSGSVSLWIAQLKAGADDAARLLWQHCYHRLVSRARAQLAGAPRRAADEEDVVLSAFDSFCRAAGQGRFPDLHDRDDLWQLLLLITDRKARDLVQYERRQRRGGGRVVDEAALRDENGSGGAAPLAQAPSPEPSPEFALLAAEECRRLLDLLDDPHLQQAALRKLEGYTVEEIAAQLGVVPRTVKRWLRLIRQAWEQDLRP
jgi:DNA-directed RNA polymerase specialized sigma24 family protein